METKTPAEEFLDKNYKKAKDKEVYMHDIFYILYPESANGMAKITREKTMGSSKYKNYISYMAPDSSTIKKHLRYCVFVRPDYIKEESPIEFDRVNGKVTVRYDNIKSEKVSNPDHPEWPMTTKYTDAPPTVVVSDIWYRDKTSSAISQIGSPFGLGTSALTKKFGGKRKRKTKKTRKTRK